MDVSKKLHVQALHATSLQRMCSLITAFLIFSTVAYAQQKIISGHIVDEFNEPLPGATVALKNSSSGTITNDKGDYSINASVGDVLVVSFVGNQTLESKVGESNTIDFTMKSTSSDLNQVVVVAYGTARKKDLTGSVATVSEKDFQKGQISTIDQLFTGKVAGVQITPGTGAPGSSGRIRIRGGSSLNASNSPLIVIDGVPIDNIDNSISGVSNPLSFINPSDIESMTVLKDASAAAIYGSRAANGVILVTTKKGLSSQLKIGFSTLTSVAVKTGTVDVLNGDEFRSLVNNYTGTIASPADRKLVGTANTNWQELIYRQAVTTDNNINLSGGVKGLPYRLSLGYLNQNGILLRDNLQRTSVGLNLSPTFLDDHLSVRLNSKFARTNSFFANQAAVGAAVYYDPTQVPNSGKDAWGGYTEWLNGTQPNLNAPRNPLGLLNQREDNGQSDRIIGNVQVDYKFHFLPELRANLNVGLDRSNGSGTVFVPATAASQFSRGGTNNQYQQTKTNKLLEFYGNYAKDLTAIKSHLDLVAGYSYQDWKREDAAFPDLTADGTVFKPAGVPGFTQNTLVSFYGRLNYNFDSKYLLTFTMRRDGSSRFSPDNRWGNFPSAAIAWRLKDEDFLKDSKVISDFKVRVGWGITGQQDGISDYGYQPNYFYGDSAAQYQFGNRFLPVLRPQGYDANLKWEETETKNLGIDLGFLNNRLNISFDYFKKNTKDLLAIVPVAAGTNFTNNLLTNVGSIQNQGLELTVSSNIISRKDFSVDISFNATYLIQNEITKLQLVNDPNYLGADVGGTGFNTVQKHTVGYRPYTFFVYSQVYNTSGKPIEGFYADGNGNGTIGETDKKWYKNPEPNAFLGFSANITYMKFSLGFVLRSNLGNYIYNGVKAGSGIYQNVFPNQGYLSNAHRDILNTGFDNRQTWSDYYLENASFLKMDNLNIAYNLGTKLNIHLNAGIQNVFVITKYTGLDPEVAGGIDNAIYPRPRVFSLGGNINF